MTRPGSRDQRSDAYFEKPYEEHSGSSVDLPSPPGTARDYYRDGYP